MSSLSFTAPYGQTLVKTFPAGFSLSGYTVSLLTGNRFGIYNVDLTSKTTIVGSNIVLTVPSNELSTYFPARYKLTVTNGSGTTELFTGSIYYSENPNGNGIATDSELASNSSSDRAYAIQRANHTGTQSAATISGGTLPTNTIPDLSSLYSLAVAGDKWVLPSGDTTGATDSANIQSAINALNAISGGGTLHLSGRYYTNTTILVKSFVQINGFRATIKQVNASNLDAVIASPAALTAGGSNNLDGPIQIRGIKIEGNSANQTSGVGRGIHLAAGGDSNGLRTEITKCIVLDTRGDGIVLSEYNTDGTTLGTGGSATHGVEPRIVDNMVLRTGGRGIWVQHSSANLFTDGFCEGNVSGYARLDGIRIDSSAGWQINKNHTYASGLTGILVQYAYATHISDNYIEGIGALDTTDRTSSISTFLIAPTWGSGTTYVYNQVVTYSGIIYISKVDGNIAHQPDTSSAQWTAYAIGGTTVAGLASINANSGRPAHITNNQISLGHVSWTLQSAWSYRGIILQGPSSGSTRHTCYLLGNDVVNELQPAGSNTIGYRLATGTGGLRVIERNNAARGSWTTLRSADTAVNPSGAVGAGASGGTGASVTVTGSDRDGNVSVTAGNSGLASGNLVTVSFSTSFSATPRVTLTPRSSTSAAIASLGLVTVNPSTSGFTLVATNAPSSGAVYSFDYFVEGT